MKYEQIKSESIEIQKVTQKISTELILKFYCLGSLNFSDAITSEVIYFTSSSWLTLFWPYLRDRPLLFLFSINGCNTFLTVLRTCISVAIRLPCD